MKQTAKQKGHIVLRVPLPPYQRDLNPIEMLQSHKQYTKARNTIFERNDVQILMNEAISKVTNEQVRSDQVLEQTPEHRVAPSTCDGILSVSVWPSPNQTPGPPIVVRL